MNKKRKLTTSLLAGTMASVLFFSSIAFPSPAYAAETVEQLEERYNQIEKELKENEKKINQNAQQQTQQKQVISNLESEIAGLNSQISILDQKISLLKGDIQSLNNNIYALDAEIEGINAKITQTKIEISMSQTKIDLTYKKVLDRLSLSYMMGSASDLEVLIGAKSLVDILTRQQYLQNAAEYDKNMIEDLESDIQKLNEMTSSLDAAIDQINAKKAEIQKQKKELIDKQASVQTSVNDLASKKGAIDAKRSDAVALMKTLDTQSAEYKRIKKQLQAEQEKVDAEIDALIASKGSSQGQQIPVEIKNDGTLIWPMPYDNCYISAYYPSYSDGSPHHGIDICVSGGTEGKNIIAAQSGKAMTVGYGHWSMGNYIILDHGNGLFTAYYHCSAILISQGATVSQGQTIARAGHTGNTTGPHLHFEVRVNRNGTVSRVNPLNYVSKP